MKLTMWVAYNEYDEPSTIHLTADDARATAADGRAIECLVPGGFRELLGLADILLAYYPETIFTGTSEDPGAKLVTALRTCKELLEAHQDAEPPTRDDSPEEVVGS